MRWLPFEIHPDTPPEGAPKPFSLEEWPQVRERRVLLNDPLLPCPKSNCVCVSPSLDSNATLSEKRDSQLKLNYLSQFRQVAGHCSLLDAGSGRVSSVPLKRSLALQSSPRVMQLASSVSVAHPD